MSVQPKLRSPWYLILILVAVALKVYTEYHPENPRKPARHSSPAPAAPEKPDTPVAPGAAGKIGGYEVYHGCKLVENRQNDGDSFLVRLPSGRQEIFRLYFVDTPESAFRSYANGETNHRRIGEQAQAMGGITPEKAVEIGQEAKHLTLGLLGKRPFTVYTRWDSPFHDGRYHAFVDTNEGGKTARWLDEILVEKGYVRIHTKGADMPDGTPQKEHVARLKTLENAAKKARAGAWESSR